MATKESIYEQVVRDLGVNYNVEDGNVLQDIIDDVINDALIMSNRDIKITDDESKETQLDILASNIKKAVKTIYLQRGVEDVKSNSQSGLSNTYDDVMDTMLKDIVRQNKRVLR